jgi:uncharacterized membrane protein YGL010W
MKHTLQNLMQGYYQHHTKKWTLWTHLIGIPLVSFACFILFGWIKVSVPGLFSLNLAWIGVIVFAVYYMCLDVIIGAAASVLLIILCAIASLFTTLGPNALNFKIFLITFILGWIFQLIGHVIEGKKPALLSHFFESVFIAPFFISAEILFMFGIKKDLQNSLTAKSESTEDTTNHN